MQKTKGNLIIVVSEGIKVVDGRYVCELADSAQETDSFGHKRLTGTARFLADECTKRLGVKARAIEFSTLQRCASHIASATDISEAYQAGAAAVEAAASGYTGVGITLVRANNKPYQCTTGRGDIEQIANHEKTVPLDWIDESGMGLREEFIEYAKPLIEGELLPYYENGLPKHLK